MDKVRDFLIKSFRVPNPMNWGYPVLFASLGTILCFFIFRAAYSFLPYTSTSLVGYSFSSLIFTLIVFAAPAVFLARRFNVSISGHYTGIGVLLMALLSGAPLYLLRTALQNVTVFLWMRLGNSVVYPFLFCYTDDHAPLTLSLELLTDTIVPAFGVALFFYGIVWSSIRPKDRRLSRLTGIILSGVLAPADITTLLTYQDISVSYFYAAAPAVVVGIILLMFFSRALGEFNFNYNNSIYGDNLDADFREEQDRVLPPALAGFNVALLVGVIIIIVMWGLLIGGVRA